MYNNNNNNDTNNRDDNEEENKITRKKYYKKKKQKDSDQEEKRKCKTRRKIFLNFLKINNSRQTENRLPDRQMIDKRPHCVAIMR